SPAARAGREPRADPRMRRRDATFRGHYHGVDARIGIVAARGRWRRRHRRLIAGRERSTAASEPALLLDRQLLPLLLVLLLDLLAPVREALADLVHLGLLLVSELLQLRGLLVVERARLRRLRGLDQGPALVLERGDLGIELVPQRLYLCLERVQLRVVLVPQRLDLRVEIRDAGILGRGRRRNRCGGG